ncbi:MAG: Ig-like domain-containing protein [Erysipelotrichaceae bacterium]|jgi:hypothetical protein|nr:Ig-like domain-containing protein [Erysipelotrichaceae bacterium]
MKKTFLLVPFLFAALFGCGETATGPTTITIEGPATAELNVPAQYTVTVAPLDASKDVSWTVEPTNLATITQSGLLTGVNNGDVTITAKSKVNEVVGTKVVTLSERKGGDGDENYVPIDGSILVEDVASESVLGDRVLVDVRIMGMNPNSWIVGDTTGNILVFLPPTATPNLPTDYEIGDHVSIAANVAERYGIRQLATTAIEGGYTTIDVTRLDTAGPVVDSTAASINQAWLTNFMTASPSLPPRVTFNGTIYLDGSFTNVKITGTSGGASGFFAFVTGTPATESTGNMTSLANHTGTFTGYLTSGPATSTAGKIDLFVVSFVDDNGGTTDPDPDPDPDPVDGVTLIYSGATVNMTGENDAATVGLDPTIFSVVSDKGPSGQNHIGLNKGGWLALYQTGGGCTLTVSVTSGYVIDSYVLTYKTNNTNDATIKIEFNGTVEDLTTTTSPTPLASKTVNGSSIAIHNVHTSNIQFHIMQMVISYHAV